MTDFEFLTTEFKQCELIWGKVYEEYKRIGFRLKKEEPKELSLLDDI